MSTIVIVILINHHHKPIDQAHVISTIKCYESRGWRWRKAWNIRTASVRVSGLQRNRRKGRDTQVLCARIVLSIATNQ
jgi:hypothetical protein